jgi:ribosomal protein L11 methyltransferase
MCLELLLELADADPARGSAADLGTGSGVLAIAAAKLGYSPVVGCDHELPAIEAATANAALNDAAVEIRRLNLREQDPPPASIWLVNLTAPLLLPLAERLPPEGPARPRGLILSGLLTAERERVVAAYADGGYAPAAQRQRGEWTALLLRGDR